MAEASEPSLFAGRYSESAIVLHHDSELADAVADQRREQAARASVAPVLRVRRGKWDARPPAERTRGGQGLLVLDGLLVRRVGIDDRFAAELLGPGDILRPLEHDGEEATLPFEATWRVLAPLTLAVLDQRWGVRMAPYHEVGIALAGGARRGPPAGGPTVSHPPPPPPGGPRPRHVWR